MHRYDMQKSCARAPHNAPLPRRNHPPLDLYQTLFEVIDMRSFSNLWFWIAVAVIWSSASHWVIGVPYDMVLRARRQGEQALVDLEDMVRINVNRILMIAQVSGLWILGFTCFFMTTLVMLATFYRFEFAQAVLLLAFPLTIVAVLSVSTAQQIHEEFRHRRAADQAIDAAPGLYPDHRHDLDLRDGDVGHVPKPVHRPLRRLTNLTAGSTHSA